MATAKDFKRITSGIPGLDKLIEGGFVKGTVTLISGGTGTGKTIFCTQFLMEGLKKGENCMFITLEERPEDIVDDVRRFGWDLEKYIKNKKLVLDYKDPFQVTDITTPIINKVKKEKIQRIVIDSTSTMGLYFKDEFEVRKQLFKLLSGLREAGVTSLITAELVDEEKISRFGVEEFVVDGVVLLHYLGIGESTYHSLQVRKMRRTNHKKDVFPMEISNKGIIIKKG